MPTEFTVITSSSRHLGDEPGTFDNANPLPVFVGNKRDFSFICPNVDSNQTAVLMFQSLAVTSPKNLFEINGQKIDGNIPTSPSADSWNGNIMIVGRGVLKDTGNILHVEAREMDGTSSGDIDDFVLDNIVVMYKTRNLKPPVVAKTK